MRASSMLHAAATSRFFLLPSIELLVKPQSSEQAYCRQYEPIWRRST